MPPRSADEYDVFRIPHSRMMQLVNSCTRRLTVTDFANNDALFELLNNLDNVFKEFKSHEEIENEHIMLKLKQKLKALAIHNSAVCNCHKDDEFTPLFRLVEQGFLHINKSRTTSERISFGVHLRKALKQFTKRFVPHMREEEEVFQPLLMQHFSVEELIEMKNNVIKMHLQRRKVIAQVYSSVLKVSKDLAPLAGKSNRKRHLIQSALPTESESNHGTTSVQKYKDKIEPSQSSMINQLPNELMLKIFSDLDQASLFKAVQVCQKWKALVYNPTNWNRLCFQDWLKKGPVNTQTVQQEDQDDDEYDQACTTNLAYKGIEYIDDSDEELEESAKVVAGDVKILQFWLTNLLPKIGMHVRELNLSSCASLNNNLMRRILRLCPNIRDLNISYTRLGDNAFRGIRLDRLERFNSEGCENLSDNAFKYMLVATITALTRPQTHSSQHHDYHGECSHEHPQKNEEKEEEENDASVKVEYFCGDCTDNYTIEEIHQMNRKYLGHDDIEQQEQLEEDEDVASFNGRNHLKYINLSGCWSITDFGLRCIASKYDVSDLQYLNLSGCINVSSHGMNLFVNLCQLLNGENLYYCDNIGDGPLGASANGCENLGCGKKFCCRSGR